MVEEENGIYAPGFTISLIQKLDMEYSVELSLPLGTGITRNED